MRFYFWAAALLASNAAYAHHSLAATYDLDKESTIQGKVVEFLLRNPHSWLLVEAPDEKGQMQQWAIEWGAGGVLVSQGITRTKLKAGDEVVITIRPGQRPEDHRGLVKILRRPSDGFEWGTKPGETIGPWGMAPGTGGVR
jgi:hypothetical protein